MKRERDKDNEWLWKVALTKEEIAKSREEAITYQSELMGVTPDRFTCDDCKMSDRCSLAFDSYNTDGDCLYEK